MTYELITIHTHLLEPASTLFHCAQPPLPGPPSAISRGPHHTHTSWVFSVQPSLCDPPPPRFQRATPQRTALLQTATPSHERGHLRALHPRAVANRAFPARQHSRTANRPQFKRRNWAHSALARGPHIRPLLETQVFSHPLWGTQDLHPEDANTTERRTYPALPRPNCRTQLSPRFSTNPSGASLPTSKQPGAQAFPQTPTPATSRRTFPSPGHLAAQHTPPGRPPSALDNPPRPSRATSTPSTLGTTNGPSSARLRPTNAHASTHVRPQSPLHTGGRHTTDYQRHNRGQALHTRDAPHTRRSHADDADSRVRSTNTITPAAHHTPRRPHHGPPPTSTARPVQHRPRTHQHHIDATNTCPRQHHTNPAPTDSPSRQLAHLAQHGQQTSPRQSAADTRDNEPPAKRAHDSRPSREDPSRSDARTP